MDWHKIISRYNAQRSFVTCPESLALDPAQRQEEG